MWTFRFHGWLIGILLILTTVVLFFTYPRISPTVSVYMKNYRSVANITEASARGRLEEKLQTLYDGVETFVLFVGHSRSGSSLVGTILDSHPEIIIPNELDVMGNWDNYTRERIGESDKAKYRLFFDLQALSRKQAMFGIRASQCSRHYCYNVPRSWQGTYKDKIKIIGDKKASGTTIFLNDPHKILRFAQLQKTIKIPLKFIHVVRNPFDNIATILLRKLDAPRDVGRDGISKVTNATGLDKCIRSYFEKAASVHKLHQSTKNAVLDVFNRDMIYKPRETLNTLCEFLGVTCYKDFVELAINALYSKPSVTRHSLTWTPEQKQKVVEEMKKYGFYESFSFVSD